MHPQLYAPHGSQSQHYTPSYWCRRPPHRHDFPPRSVAALLIDAPLLTGATVLLAMWLAYSLALRGRGKATAPLLEDTRDQGVVSCDMTRGNDTEETVMRILE